MPSYQTHEHDVLVIGAGGAGLRAAIEASAAGVSVGLVCKSLLGKAHTVMAEGGIAAALANVDDRDTWSVHFADTMRGGQYAEQLADGRVARQRSASSSARAGSLGSAIRSHGGWTNPPAKLRRPSVSATGSRWRSHGSRDDPHAAGSRDPYGHRRPYGVHGHQAAH